MTAVQMGSEAFANWKWLQSTSGLGTTGVNQTVAALKVKYELEFHFAPARRDKIQYKNNDFYPFYELREATNAKNASIRVWGL